MQTRPFLRHVHVNQDEIKRVPTIDGGLIRRQGFLAIRSNSNHAPVIKECPPEYVGSCGCLRQ